MTALATGGDDYEIVCTAPEANAAPLQAAAEKLGFLLSVVGHVRAGMGVQVSIGGNLIAITSAGYRHS